MTLTLIFRTISSKQKALFPGDQGTPFLSGMGLVDYLASRTGIRAHQFELATA